VTPAFSVGARLRSGRSSRKRDGVACNPSSPRIPSPAHDELAAIVAPRHNRAGGDPRRREQLGQTRVGDLSRGCAFAARVTTPRVRCARQSLFGLDSTAPLASIVLRNRRSVRPMRSTGGRAGRSTSTRPAHRFQHSNPAGGGRTRKTHCLDYQMDTMPRRTPLLICIPQTRCPHEVDSFRAA